MRYIIVFLLFLLTACETHNFDRDTRQIMAKDQVRKQVRGYRGFSITGFREDTLQAWSDSAIIPPIRYTLDFVYKDSTGNSQNKKGVVIFAPEGNAILKTEITDR